MEENEYSFRVTISDERSKSYESYNLKVKVSGLTLCDAITDELILDWPFRQIRRFFRTESGIIIEMGRASASGEGKFSLDTPEPKLIYERIAENMEKLHQRTAKENEIKAKELLSSAPKGDGEYTEPYHWFQPKENKPQRSQTYSPKASPVLPHSRKQPQRSQTYSPKASPVLPHSRQRSQSSRRQEDKEIVYVTDGCVKISDKDKYPPPCAQRYTPMPPEGQRTDEGHSYMKIKQTTTDEGRSYMKIKQTTHPDSCYITPIPHSSE